MPNKEEYPGGIEGQGNKQNILMTIETPEYLSVGQNFYDQPPFADVITATHEQFGIEITKLNHSLTHITRTGFNSIAGFQGKTPVELRDLSTSNRLLRDLTTTLTIPKKSLEVVSQSVLHMIGSFADYPYWREYIRDQLVFQLYKKDGTYALRKGSSAVPPKSYAAWASEQQTQDERIKDLLVQLLKEKAFPFQETAIQDSVRNTEKKGRNRRYKLLRATEVSAWQR